MTAPEPEVAEPVDDPRRVPTHVDGPSLYGLTVGPVVLMLASPEIPGPLAMILFAVLLLAMSAFFAQYARPGRPPR